MRIISTWKEYAHASCPVDSATVSAHRLLATESIDP